MNPNEVMTAARDVMLEFGEPTIQDMKDLSDDAMRLFGQIMRLIEGDKASVEQLYATLRSRYLVGILLKGHPELHV